MDTARRTVLGGACCGAAGAALSLAGCDVFAGDESSAPTRPEAAPAGSRGTTLVTTSAIPIGGGAILDDHAIVLTQPTQGTFVAFSATCPHVGCLVTSVRDGTINCGCHGSKFALADGAVLQGPATRALTRVRITVDGADIKLA